MRVSSGLLSRALRQRRGRALLWAAGALVGAAALIAAACSGGDSDAAQPPAPEPAPQAAEVAPAATPAAEEGAATQAAEAAAGEDEPELAAVDLPPIVVPVVKLVRSPGRASWGVPGVAAFRGRGGGSRGHGGGGSGCTPAASPR